MLVELSIRNLAVIEKTDIAFSKGFMVLTGETGAGKSILIDALSLIIGGRSASDLVRYGCDKAEIEALFDIEKEHPVWTVLDHLGVSADSSERLVIRREITAQGKSTSRINGQLVNLSMLRDVGEGLVNLHGQHEHQSLLKVENHLHLLDLFAGGELAGVKSDYLIHYRAYNDLMKEIRKLEETAQKALQMADMYRFQIEEIAAANLNAAENELLTEERRKLANAEKIVDAVTETYDSLYGMNRGLDALTLAVRRLESILAFDRTALKPIFDQIQSAFYQIEDAAFQLRDYKEQIEFNPARLEQIEQRLNMIQSLKRKYGATIEDILNHLHTIQDELELMENKDENIRQLRRSAQSEYTALQGLAEKLSMLRKDAAARLSVLIEKELYDLQMERTRFAVQITNQEMNSVTGEEETTSKLTKDGWDQIEFMISANPGEPLKPLNKIASGGELSRIMLALKSIFSKIERIPVLIFDEVDTGVSGRAAQAIAEKLAHLSANCQVFSITHLPQVACMADAQYLIYKETGNERTYTHVTSLMYAERVKELARMLGGVEVTDKTLQHAQEMITLAEQKKSEVP